MSKQGLEVVIKNKILVNISGNSSFVQRKLFNVFLYKVFNDLDKIDKPFFTIQIQDIKELMGYKNNMSNIEFRNDCNGLMKTLISWGVLGDDKSVQSWQDSVLLSGVVHNIGSVDIEIPMMLRSKLVENNQYIKLNLAIQKKFTSKYSLMIYELCREFYREKDEIGETKWIDLVDLKKFLGINDTKYIDFKFFNRNVLAIAVEEINKFSDIIISLDFQRDYRRISAIKFRITKNPQFSNDRLNLLEFSKTKEIKSNSTTQSNTGQPEVVLNGVSKTTQVSQEISYRFGLYEINNNLLGKWIAQYGEEYIIEKLDLLDEGVASGKVKSPKGFLITAIQQGWEGSQKQLERTKEQQELEDRKKNPQTYRMMPHDYPDEESFLIEQERLINLFYKPSWISSDMERANVKWYG